MHFKSLPLILISKVIHTMSLQLPDTNEAVYVDYTKVSRYPTIAPAIMVSQPYLRNAFSLSSGNGPDLETLGPVASFGIQKTSPSEPAASQYTMIPPTYNGMRLYVAPDGVPLTQPPEIYRVGLANEMSGPPPESNFGLPTEVGPNAWERASADVGSKADSEAAEHSNRSSFISRVSQNYANSDSFTSKQRRDARVYPNSESGPSSRSTFDEPDEKYPDETRRDSVATIWADLQTSPPSGSKITTQSLP